MKLVVLCVLLLPLLSCSRPDAGALWRSAEEARLERQIQGLEALASAAESGALASPDLLVIGFSEGMMRDLLNAGLPREQIVGRGFTIRADSAEVLFRSSLAVVTVHGRVSRTESPGSYADVTLTGGLEGLEVNEETGRLGARVALYGFEVLKAAAGGAESELMRGALQDFTKLGSVEGLLPPFQVPVRLDREILLRGFGEGPVSVKPGSLPIHLSVARVVPLSGRLWILLNASAGPWKSLEEGSS